MTFSLYAATIPNYQQILGTVSHLLDKAEAFCAERGCAADEIILARLAPDMHPFAYQVKSTAVHSLGAIEGVRRGVFSPDSTTPPDSFPALKTRITETLTALDAIEPAEVESFIGRECDSRSANTTLILRPRIFSCRSRNRISTSMPLPSTTSCAGRVYRSASEISSDVCERSSRRGA
jgi:hypothetical protein